MPPGVDDILHQPPSRRKPSSWRGARLLACIAGAIAEARWGVPAWIRSGSEESLARFDPGLPAVLAAFEKRFGGASTTEPDPSEGKARPVVRAKLTEEAVGALAPEKVQAIAFAEVGAQGESEYILVVSDEGDHVGVTSGNFGFEAFGKRYKRDVDIERIAAVLPFLTHFVGTSRETTKRGSFAFEDGAWLHLDMAVGNHFFIRKERFEPFRQLLADRHPKNLCTGAIDAVLDIMKKEPSGHVDQPGR